jgi:hypothetical protein
MREQTMIRVTDSNYKQVVKELFDVAKSEIPVELMSENYIGDDSFRHYDGLDFFDKALTKQYRRDYQMYQHRYTAKPNKVLLGNIRKWVTNKVTVTYCLHNEVSQKWIIECEINTQSTLLVFHDNICFNWVLY